MIAFRTPSFMIGVLVLVVVVGALLFIRAGRAHRRLRPGSAIVRIVVLALLLIALGTPIIQHDLPGYHTVVVVDTSDSVEDATIGSVLEIVDRWRRDEARGDTFSVLAFGADSAAMEPGSAEFPAPDGSATNIAAALRHAAERFPPGGRRRIVLFSDGIETVGDAGPVAADLRILGIATSTILLPVPNARADLRAISIVAPDRVDPDQVFEIAIPYESTGIDSARIELFRDGIRTGGETVAVRAGTGVLRYILPGQPDGVHRYAVRLTGDRDAITQNDTVSRTVRVGAEQILYVARDSGRPLARALVARGRSVFETTPGDLPLELATIAPYPAIVLDDVDPAELTLTHMHVIERYVRETGGGLFFSGGPAAFSGTAYHTTAVEDALPVSMDVLTPVEVPSVVILYLVDRSGSMRSPSSGAMSKLEIVREAVLASVEVMRPNQEIGVVSFDSDAEETVPITKVSDREGIIEAIRSLTGGGGTDLAGALEFAAEIVSVREAAAKHLVLLSDGLTREADFRALAQSIHSDGTTISTVGIGEDADTELLELIAREGGGRSYHSVGAEAVPAIFAEEARRVSRTRTVEESFFPVIREELALIGTSVDSVPALGGIALTYPRTGATQLIDGPMGQPLLIAHRYGLGRSVAFTSAIDGGWGRRWSEWSDLSRIADQIVEWIARSEATIDTAVSFDQRTGLTVTATLPEEALDGGISGRITAIVSFRDGTSTEFPLEASGAGAYTGTLAVGSGIPDLVTVADAMLEGGREVPPVVVPIPSTYPPEYGSRVPDTARMALIARDGGGIAVSSSDTSSLSLRRFPALPDPAAIDPIDLQPLAAVLAAILLVAEVAGTIFLDARRRRPGGTSPV